MNIIKKCFKKIGEYGNILTINGETMKVKTLYGGTSKINAYPSTIKTLKGVAGSVIVLEEMAQIDPQVLYEVVMPLHQLDITTMIGISTITDENNYMTHYLNMKGEYGNPVFNARHMYLACEPCRNAGKSASCDHNNNLLPSWSSPRKRKIINAIMKGQEEILAKEIGGVASVRRSARLQGPRRSKRLKIN